MGFQIHLDWVSLSIRRLILPTRLLLKKDEEDFKRRRVENEGK